MNICRNLHEISKFQGNTNIQMTTSNTHNAIEVQEILYKGFATILGFFFSKLSIKQTK